MANVKISQLPAASSVIPAVDVLPIVHSGVTQKATPNLIVQSVLPAPGPIGNVTPSTGVFTQVGIVGASGIQKAISGGLLTNAVAGTDYIAPGGALGTPSSGTLTNCTGLPVSTGISGLGTGVATFLATPSSANLASAVTDETGTGALVFANTPTLVTPNLGTPASGTLTNCSGLPIVGGTTGTLTVARGGTGATTLTGLVKGNGTSAFTAAVSGTDYAPATSGTSILYGNGAGGFSNVSVGTGLSFTGGTLAATSGGGTVTTVSVVSANGLAGTVANPATTPAITLSTSVTGLMKGNGTSISAAVSGTDYAPATSGTAILKGNGSGGFSSATAGTDYATAPTGTNAQLLANNGSGGFTNVTVGSGLTYSGGTLASVSGGGGTVTNVSVVSANGLGGTVANASTTPAITLTTSVTGLLKGNGTGVSAAVSGTDYAPATSGSSILYGNGSGGFSNVTIGSGLSFATGTLSATGGSGTVTSVSGTGTVNGLTLTGTVTTSGSLTLGGTLDLSSPPAIGGTTPAAITGTTVTANTKFVSSYFDASGSGGGALRTASGTACLQWGGGGGTNLTLDGAFNMNPANASISIAPTGTGTLTVNPATAGTIDNVAIGGTTAAAGKFTSLTATGTTTLATSLTGLLKSTSGVVSTATSGTDYAPATSGSSILYGNGSGGFSNVTIGTNLTFSGGTLNATGGGSMVYPGAGIAVSTGSAWGTSKTTPTGDVVGTTDTQTLSNKTLLASGSNTVEATSGPGSTQLAGNRNKIINGAMMIDQRNAGAAVTPGSGISYTLDRWAFQSNLASKFTIQQNAGSVTPPAGFNNYLGATVASAATLAVGDYCFLWQALEGFNCVDLAWGTSSAKAITLSFWVYSSLTGTFGGSIQNYASTRSYPFSYTVGSANTWTQITITIPGDTGSDWLTVNKTNGGALVVNFGLGLGSTFSGTAGAWITSNKISVTGAVNVISNSGATFYITGVQLEKGSVATPFENRIYSDELAMCQRYCYVQNNTGSNPPVATGCWAGSTSVDAYIFFPISMRSSPSLSISAISSVYALEIGVAWRQASSYSLYDYGNASARYGLTCASNSTYAKGQGTTVDLQATCLIIWSAEL